MLNLGKRIVSGIAARVRRPRVLALLVPVVVPYVLGASVALCAIDLTAPHPRHGHRVLVNAQRH
jgi:hypothetical protein